MDRSAHSTAHKEDLGLRPLWIFYNTISKLHFMKDAETIAHNVIMFEDDGPCPSDLSPRFWGSLFASVVHAPMAWIQ